MNNPDLLKYLRNPASLNETTLPVMEQMVKDYPWFQTGWMLYLKNLKNLDHPDYLNHLKKVALRVPDRKWLKKFLYTNDHSEKPGKNDTDQQYNLENGYALSEVDINDDGKSIDLGRLKLIDSFLAKGATFKNLSNGDQGGSSVDLSEKAVTVSDDIITETFANLLLNQAKYEEVIEAFKKLSLKFPGKSVYFTGRIEEVKKLMNH